MEEQLVFPQRHTERRIWMLRFSRDNRFLIPISLVTFTSTLEKLRDMIAKEHPRYSAALYTTTDYRSYVDSCSTLLSEGEDPRQRHGMEALTEDLWKQSFSVDAIFTDTTCNLPFMIAIAVDRHADRRSVKFYGQQVTPTLATAIHEAFARPSLSVSIGDGYRKIPKVIREFHFAVAKRK